MDSASEDVPLPPMESSSSEASSTDLSSMTPHESAPENLPNVSFPPPAPQFRAGLSDDLRVPWGWMEVALFVILGVIGSVVVTWGAAEVAVRFFGVNSNEVFGPTMSTAKSVVVLISQAALDAGAILYLYLMLLARTEAPFWPTIGWREMLPAREKFGTQRCDSWRSARCWPWWLRSRAGFSIRKKPCRSRSC